MIRLITTVIMFLILCLAGCCFAAYLGYEQLNTKVLHTKSDTIITIKKGESTEDVLAKLEQEGIITNRLPLKVYIKLQGHKSLIKAGDFKFQSPISPLGALAILEAGSMEHLKLTVIEGSTIFDVADSLAKTPSLKLASTQEAMKLLQNKDLIKELDPAAKNLEGYLFPDTYYVQKETTAPELVASMVHRFKEIWQKYLADDARQKGLTAHEVVTIGSIVETEAKLDEERPVVASVIFNRLKSGTRLSVDSTIVYASKLNGKWKNDGKIYQSDIRLKSPYNTRIYKGLPPGPVGNPGLSSLQAALNPADTRYIYYVRDPDFNNGKHNFYVTPADFEKGVKKLREWEEKQRKAGLR
ncbi:MAG: endolytic transglycosylase MltG [Cyanobacteriota/Melainabacteria group bacterium]|nr:endolytic transglycosylase MltG [Candidatus Obscuribacterales bacterium]